MWRQAMYVMDAPRRPLGRHHPLLGPLPCPSSAAGVVCQSTLMASNDLALTESQGDRSPKAIQDVGPRARVDERHLLQHRVCWPIRRPILPGVR